MHVHKNPEVCIGTYGFPLIKKKTLSLSLLYCTEDNDVHNKDTVPSFPGHSHQSVSAEFLSLLDNGTEWTE